MRSAVAAMIERARRFRWQCSARLGSRRANRNTDVAGHHGRIARFIALPVQHALNSRCDVVRNSRASARASRKSSPACAAYSGSVNSFANDTFQGHTSCGMYRYTRFQILLGTAARTLRGATGQLSSAARLRKGTHVAVPFNGRRTTREAGILR